MGHKNLESIGMGLLTWLFKFVQHRHHTIGDNQLNGLLGEVQSGAHQSRAVLERNVVRVGVVQSSVDQREHGHQLVYDLQVGKFGLSVGSHCDCRSTED